MSADLILIADDLTPNGADATYEKFLVRTVLVRAEGFEPVFISYQEALIAAMRPYVGRLDGPRVLIVGMNNRYQVMGIRSVPATPSAAELSTAMTETAAVLGAASILLAAVGMDSAPAGAAAAVEAAAETCTSVPVLDRVYL